MRAELAHVYADAYGKACRHDTLTALESIVAWLRRCERNDGITVLRSVPQAVRGIEGWEPTGRKKLDHNRFRNSLTRRLDMLIELGVVEWWDSDYKANGMGRGILVRLRRDSSVGGAHLAAAGSRRPPRRPGPPSPPTTGEGPRRRPSNSTRVSPPLRENSVPQGADGDEVPSRHPSVHGKRNCRRATRTRGQRSGHRVTASAIRSLSEAGQEAGAELIGRLPWLCDLQPAVLLRAVVVAERNRTAGWQLESLAISEPSRLIVEAAYDELDRLDGRGAGAAAIIDLARGGWRHHRLPSRRGELEAPRTPGALAKPLRQRARMARRAAQLRSGAL